MMMISRVWLSIREDYRRPVNQAVPNCTGTVPYSQPSRLNDATQADSKKT